MLGDRISRKPAYQEMHGSARREKQPQSLITASLVFCVVRRVKVHHNLLHYLSLLKKTCVR